MAKASESEIVIRLGQWNKDETFRLQSQAEKRVGFFLALVSVLFALRAVGTDIFGIPLLVILLLYGLETLQFLNWIKIQEHKNTDIDKIIGKSLAELSETARSVISENEQADQRIPKGKLYSIRGGLAEFMYVTNALLLSAIVHMQLKRIPLTLVTFILFAWFQFIASQQIRLIGAKK